MKKPWKISGGGWQLKIHIGPLGDTLGVGRYKSNKHTPPPMPATATAVVVVAVVEEAERVEGWRRWWRRVTGSRGCTEAAGWRARTSGSIRAPGATQGEKQQSASPFLPGKVLGHGTLSRALLAPVLLAKGDDKFRAAVKSGALSLFLERRSRGGHLPGKGSDRIGSDRTRGLRELD